MVLDNNDYAHYHACVGVLDWPHGVRVSAGRGQGPFDPVEPGAQPVPLLKGLTDWLTWTTTAPRPWTPVHPDQARGNLFPFVTSGSDPKVEVYAGGLEEIGLSMAINDMLLLVTGWPRQDPVIRLFPVWRLSAGAGPASFSGLRAKGGFVISAAWNNATDEVSGVKIVSDSGRRCALLSPWARATHPGSVLVVGRNGSEVPVHWRSGDPRGAIVEWATTKGAEYELHPVP